MTDQVIFRVIREKVDDQTIRITLEPYRGIQHVDVHEGDEFITGTLNSDGYLSLKPGELCPQAEAKQWLADRSAAEVSNG